MLLKQLVSKSHNYEFTYIFIKQSSVIPLIITKFCSASSNQRLYIRHIRNSCLKRSFEQFCQLSLQIWLLLWHNSKLLLSNNSIAPHDEISTKTTHSFTKNLPYTHTHTQNNLSECGIVT